MLHFEALDLSCCKPVAEWVRSANSISQTCRVFRSSERNLKALNEIPLTPMMLSCGCDVTNILDGYRHGIEASALALTLGP